MPSAPALLLLLVLAQLGGTPSRLNAEYRNWKPGPKVVQELARIDHESRMLFKGLRDGKIPQWTVICEQARRKIEAETLRFLSFTSGSDEIPVLMIVITDSDEYLRVFPRGRSHVPRELVAGQVYPATRGSYKYWEYIGDREVSGVGFSIYRLIQEPKASGF